MIRRSLMRAAARKRIPTNDPYWANVVALLHLDGANGATVFTDQKGHTFTAAGTAQISTAQSRFGGASLLLDGASWLSSANHADWNLGAGDFAIEASVRLTAYAPNEQGQFKAAIVTKDIEGARAFGFNITGTATSFTGIEFIGFSDNSTGYDLASANYAFSLNTWYDVMAARIANRLYLSVGGSVLNPGGTAFTRTIQTTATSLLIGALNFNTLYRYRLNGNIDEPRVTKGVGRVAAPLTGPFPNA